MAVGSAALAFGGVSYGLSAKSYGRILGANDKVRVGLVGFSARHRNTLVGCLRASARDLNFEITGISDIWSRRREEGKAFVKDRTGWDVSLYRNNEEMYDRNEIDAVIISTVDFQHALHLVDAAKAKKHAFVEKPLAETMDDANAAVKAVNENQIVVSICTQRRSGPNFFAANEFIRSGGFGDIVMVEMSWNVNQPGRWRQPVLVNEIRQEDTDWDRFLMNRPKVDWCPRKYLEFRLFWPYSSGIPGQWMCHQIDTVHWFTGLPYPRSVVANGGIYMWKDGRTNADTLTAVFDYGPLDNPDKGFQVVYSSRFSNSAGGTREVYFSNGGMLDLRTNRVTADGGLAANHARAMGMEPNQLTPFDLPSIGEIAIEADAGLCRLTLLHMRNWMECVRAGNMKTNCPVEAGHSHVIACSMANAAIRTGLHVTYDPITQQIMAGDKVFRL